MYFINRFPICALWYYCVARKAGFSEAQAKSLAICRATFFAAAKGGFGKGGGSRKRSAISGIAYSSSTPVSPDSVKRSVINFAGLEVQLNEQGFAVFGEVIQTPEMFNRRVIEKFGTELTEVVQKMGSEANKYGPELNSNLAYSVYSTNRDFWRSKETA